MKDGQKVALVAGVSLVVASVYLLFYRYVEERVEASFNIPPPPSPPEPPGVS